MTDKNDVKIQCCNALWNRGTVEVGAQVSYSHRSNKISEVVSLNKERFWFSALSVWFAGSVVQAHGEALS